MTNNVYSNQMPHPVASDLGLHYLQIPICPNRFIIILTFVRSLTCSLFGLFSFQHLEQIHHILKDVFLIFPNYCLGRGLMDVAFNQYKNDFYFKTGKSPQ